MVSAVSELRDAKAILAGVQAELGESAGVLGVMIEVPAAVAIADQLAREAAFFSIGTNDLVQYVMAADRTNARVAPLADPLQPAVLRMMRQTIEAGTQAGIPVDAVRRTGRRPAGDAAAARAGAGRIQRERAADPGAQAGHWPLDACRKQRIWLTKPWRSIPAKRSAGC